MEISDVASTTNEHGFSEQEQFVLHVMLKNNLDFGIPTNKVRELWEEMGGIPISAGNEKRRRDNNSKVQLVMRALIKRKHVERKSAEGVWRLLLDSFSPAEFIRQVKSLQEETSPQEETSLPEDSSPQQDSSAEVDPQVEAVLEEGPLPQAASRPQGEPHQEETIPQEDSVNQPAA